jgi:hypothetical protein
LPEKNTASPVCYLHLNATNEPPRTNREVLFYIVEHRSESIEHDFFFDLRETPNRNLLKNLSDPIYALKVKGSIFCAAFIKLNL